LLKTAAVRGSVRLLHEEENPHHYVIRKTRARQQAGEQDSSGHVDDIPTDVSSDSGAHPTEHCSERARGAEGYSSGRYGVFTSTEKLAVHPRRPHIRRRSTCGIRPWTHLSTGGPPVRSVPASDQGSPPQSSLVPQQGGKYVEAVSSRKKVAVVHVLRPTIGNSPQRRRVVGQPM